ncbi:MAG: GIY-YIG nuclease family protein, partial [Elusimicrobia bacterium]|nr:GIY-YIG nuclease family protein [Elusimicrobiota bacterium]
MTIEPFPGTPVNKPPETAGYAHLPHNPGVYIMRDAGHEILYVGKAKDLAKRVACYFNPKTDDHKTTLLAPLIRSIDYVPCASEREALLWERRLIRKHQPFFNAMWKDDKSYPYVKITLNEDYPRVFLTRHKKRDGAAYFGPYPKVTPIRSLLRSLWNRRFFPLRPCGHEFSEADPLAERKVKACLYYHTGECPAPCAGRISPEDYRAIAKNAVLFFSGRTRRLKELFVGEMSAASAALEYERAALLRD